MTETEELMLLLAAWPAAGIVILGLARRARINSVGLPLAYFLGWGLIHWPGAALYLMPEHAYYDFDVVLSGFELTTMGLGAYCAGIFLGEPRFHYRQPPATTAIQPHAAHQRALHQSAFAFLFIGLATQLLLVPLIGQVASLTAFLSGLATLSVVGVCLGLHESFVDGNRRRLALWASVGVMFPLITLTSSAFLGLGTYSLLVVIAFLAMHFSQRKVYLAAIALLPAVLLGISLYVTYMRDRSDLRQAMWVDNAGQQERLQKVAKLFLEFEFLDLDNPNHLIAIDQRLNQNFLVGAAQDYLEVGNASFTYGESILQAFTALVPRMLWPDKPQFGGSGNMVSEFTGITFSEGTSVGAGQVFELFINFGDWGVIVGFFILGAIIRQFDFRAAQGLREASYGRFVLWFVPGLGLLQAGGNLAEVTASVAASVGAALAAAYAIEQRLSKQRPAKPEKPRRATP